MIPKVDDEVSVAHLRVWPPETTEKFRKLPVIRFELCTKFLLVFKLMPSKLPCFFHYRVNKFINREQGLCYVKGHDLGGTVEPSLFIEKELSGAGGGFDGVG